MVLRPTEDGSREVVGHAFIQGASKARPGRGWSWELAEDEAFHAASQRMCWACGRLAFEARLPETEKVQLRLVCSEGDTAAGDRGCGVGGGGGLVFHFLNLWLGSWSRARVSVCMEWKEHWTEREY